MRIGVHLTLMVLGEVAGFILGALLMFALLPTELGASSLFSVYTALLFAGPLAGVFLARWLFGRVGARCPHCGGPAFPRGVRPIAYHCGGCGHVHETRFRSNW